MLLVKGELNGGMFIIIIAGKDINITAAASTAHHALLLPHLEAVDHGAAHLHLRLDLPGDAELVESSAPAGHHHVVVVELDDLDLAVPGRELGGDCPGAGPPPAASQSEDRDTAAT